MNISTVPFRWRIAGSVILGICSITLVGSAFAQHAYFSFNAGYSLSSGSQTLGRSSTTEIVSGQSVASREGVYGSLGEGIKLGGSFGYMFSQNVGIEFAGGYWIGKEFEFVSKSTSQQPATNTTETDKLSGTGFVLVPSIVVAAGTQGVNPYARLGGAIGFLKTKTDMSFTITTTSSSRTETTVEESGNIALGFVGGLGVEFGAGSTVSFFIEASLLSVTYSPSQLELTKFTENGVDRLSSITDKKIDYKDSYKSTDKNVTQAVRRPFSSIGGAAGIRINI